MFRDILTSRAILAGFLFFLLVVISSLLYNWYVRREIAAELTRPDPVIQQLENKKENHTAQDVGVSINTNRVGETPPLETDASQTISDDREILPVDETSELDDVVDAFLPNDVVSEEESSEGPVSPFGFGPYPELPEGWPSDIWPRSSPDHELMMRVRIKLIAQGINVSGARMNNGLVYPTIKNTVYVEWDEEAGHRYISNLSGDPEACKRLNAIEEARENEGGFSEADIPSEIKIVPFEEGGIDPYQFLELP